VVLPQDSVRVGNSDGTSLGLSEIALGARGRAASWITEAGDTVLLAPSSTFRKGSEVELYFEATGATPGVVYRHEITVLRSGKPHPDRRRPLVAVSFFEEAAAPVIRSHRTVRLGRLKEGSYLVEVKIIAPDGTARIRQRSLRIIKNVSGERKT
jgi:hypothetical protein